MSTLKMTFSLASLILMFAFVAMPAMAHDTDPGQDGNQHGPSDSIVQVGTHTHAAAPTVESIELVDIMVDGASTARDGSVVLVADANAANLALADGVSAAGQFVVKITFREDVYGGTLETIPTAGAPGSPATAATATDLVETELTVNAAEVGSNQELFGANSIIVVPPQHQIEGVTGIPTMTAAITADTEDLKVFYVTFEVDNALFGVEEADTADLPINIWISVNENAVFTRTGLVNGSTVYGTGNTASTREKFTIVDELEPAAPPTLPTVTIEAEDDATVDAPFDVTFTFGDPAPTAFAASAIMVTNGLVTDGPTQDATNAKVWTATITPVLNATEVTVGVDTAVATGTAEEVTATSPPTVTIAVPPTATVDAAFTVTLTFSEAVALAKTDIEVTGGGAGDPMPATADAIMDTMWTVVITPTVGATSVVVGVVAAKATGTERTVTAVTEEVPMLDPQEYLIVVRDKSVVTSDYFGANGPSADDVLVWADMPNLERLFGVGGKLELTVAGATATRQVVISEVMWGVDEKIIGQAAAAAGQWIEIHNTTPDDDPAKGKSFPISDITFTSAEGRFPTPSTTDWLMNTPAGDKWTVPGQSGNTGSDVNGVITGQKEFISVFRNHYGESGDQASRWTASSELYKRNHKGTPGQKERPNFGNVKSTDANRGPIIINEVANHSNSAYEWIELRNVSGSEQNLKNWKLTIATAVGSDVDLINFTDDDRKVPAGEILLVVKTDPTDNDDHPLAAGWNFGLRNTWTPAKPGEANWVKGVNENSARYMVAKSFGDMPNNGEFVLILRDHNDKKGTADHVRDVAGFRSGGGLTTTDNATRLWPLNDFDEPKWSNNKLAHETVQRRQFADIDGTKSKDKDQNDKTAFRDDDNGWSGIGYKRNADSTDPNNGGTPGHPHSAHSRHHKHDATARSSVIVNEVMPSTGPRNLPEWIELRNTSATEAVSVHKWRITITNHDKDSEDGAPGSFAGELSIPIEIDGEIPPKQTYLIVARTGRKHVNLPDQRIDDGVGKRVGQLLLNPYGFQIKVEAWEKDNVYHLVETVGNLRAAPAGNRRGDAQSFLPTAWDLPATLDDDNNRVSLVRVSGKAGPIDGMKIGAWKRFDESKQIGRTLDATYYGHLSDLGSPGHTVGGVLPVSLSKFRPERLKDTGEIVVRWITESELNNAGFNILRSDKRDGEFTKVQFVAGKGTTSERTLYEWKDKSAKPNVVYYYQIQDVSLDGQVSVLATTHLRGNVSAAGKLTTTWGELKALQ